MINNIDEVTPPTPAKAPTPASPPVNSGWKSRAIHIGIGVAVVAVIVGASYWAATIVGKSNVQTDATLTPAETTKEVATEATAEVDDVTWLAQAKKIDDPKIFSVANTDNTYHQVGTSVKSGDIFLIRITNDGPGYLVGLVTKDSQGAYRILKNHSDNLFDATTKEYQGPKLSEGVTVDTATSFKSLAYQAELLVSDQTLKSAGRYFDSYIYLSSITDRPLKEFAKTDYGTVYTRTLGKGDGFEVQEYVLKRPDFSTVSYQLQPTFVTDDQVPQVTWKSGGANKDTYRADGVGSCGSLVGISVLNSTALTSLTETGTTRDGDKVYEFSSANNETLNYFYKQYSTGNNSAISLEQYRAKHAVFVWKDKFNRLIVFNSTVYGSQVECGKPVVYLYPTQPTRVSVSVGADVTKSEPFYGRGWQALALPTGELFVGGQKYPYLFWEGTGHGAYPAINEGFVVETKHVAATLNDHLAKLGLNKKEAADFMEFWLPKMPAKPFVRLTWFGTSQMDQLAPLTVSPKPDTSIRIFLDFEGLEQPVALKSQRLIAPARQGFTLVEWGGLLRTPAAVSPNN